MGLTRVRRFGLRVVILAAALRLLTCAIERETGPEVRFSTSSEAIFHVRESPAPELPGLVFTEEEAAQIQYFSDLRPDPGSLLTRELSWSLRGEAPTVLILHTHTTESYAGGGYPETSPYRTLSEGHNMLSIGAEVASLLEAAGIPTVQIRQVHDYPAYAGSYGKSRQSVKDALEAYPSIQLVLDLHRDAGSGSNQPRPVVQGDGETLAQLMLVMGSDASGQNHPRWQENLSIALKLHAQLERQVPGIMRPLQLRSQRFNQDLSPGALLVEVGAAGNTPEEALAAARQLAKAIIALADGVR